MDGKPLSGHPAASSGKALLELGYAESILDQKRIHNNATLTKSSGDSTLLKILVAPDEVSFETSKIDDFAVSFSESGQQLFFTVPHCYQ